MIAFTICSNNYIYKAQVLALSIQNLSNTPYLFLADGKDEGINYKELNFEKVVYLDELAIPNLQWMKENYNIVELNTAIKSFAFKYLFKNTDTDIVYFFDPDVKVYQPIGSFEQFWGDNSILLTPHILTPIPFDGKFPQENLFLNHGIYNLGFLGLKKSAVADRLLNWWAERMLENCFINLTEGYFVDQIWFNLVPLFFKSTTIIEHYGCNVSYWNLHERHVTLNNNQYIVNNTQPLYFYHFSHFDVSIGNIHTIENFRYTFENSGMLKSLYKDYLLDVNKFNPQFFKGFTYFNGQYPFVPPPLSIFEKLLRKAKSLFK